MFSIAGPASNSFFMKFGPSGATNTARLFYSIAANQGVTGSISGDIGLQLNVSGQSLLFGTTGTLLYRFSRTGLTFPIGLNQLNNVYPDVSSQVATFPFTNSTATLNIVLKFYRCGSLCVIVLVGPQTTPTGVSSSTFTYTNGVGGTTPTYMIPSASVTNTIMVGVGGSACAGQITVNSAGSITIQPMLQTTVAGVVSAFAGAFPVSTTCGILQSQRIVYFV
jgi:hypothetical protein